MPTRMPSSVAVSRATRMASSNSTSMTSSRTLRSRIAGTKFGPMPWILCGPGWPSVSTGESLGSTAMICTSGLALLEHLADAGDGAARADAGDEDVDLAVGVVPDLLGRRLAVDRGVRLVLELAWPRWRRGSRRRSASRRSTASDMPLVGSVSTSSAPNALSSVRRSFDIDDGHRQDDLVAARRADHREGDAGVAARATRRSCRRAAARPMPRRRRRWRCPGGP